MNEFAVFLIDGTYISIQSDKVVTYEDRITFYMINEEDEELDMVAQFMKANIAGYCHDNNFKSIKGK